MATLVESPVQSPVQTPVQGVTARKGAPPLGILLLARVMQGAGGGALQPILQAVLLESFPPKKRGAAMALFGFGVVVARRCWARRSAAG